MIPENLPDLAFPTEEEAERLGEIVKRITVRWLLNRGAAVPATNGVQAVVVEHVWPAHEALPLQAVVLLRRPA